VKIRERAEKKNPGHSTQTMDGKESKGSRDARRIVSKRGQREGEESEIRKNPEAGRPREPATKGECPTWPVRCGLKNRYLRLILRRNIKTPWKEEQGSLILI